MPIPSLCHFCNDKSVNNLYICDRRDWNELNEISQLDLSLMSLGKNWDDIVEEGSKLIDKDLAYTYKIKRGQARRLKENFAVANTKYASIDDTIDSITFDCFSGLND